VLVEENGPIHISKLSLAALAARSHWLTVEWLPQNTLPNSTTSKPSGATSRRIHLAHQTFTDVAALDQAIHNAVHDLNQERMPVPLAKPHSA
jgi:hypothetical protein